MLLETTTDVWNFQEKKEKCLLVTVSFLFFLLELKGCLKSARVVRDHLNVSLETLVVL